MESTAAVPTVGPGRIKSYDEMLANYSPENNLTLPVMTRFERAKLLGLRTEQLARGSDPCVPLEDPLRWTPSDVAQMELYAKTIPYIIARSLPDGSREIWNVRDLTVHDFFT